MLHGVEPVFVVSGLVVGLLVGFTGVGGGSLMTPLLVLVFGVHPATAVGTDLLYAGLTKISGCAVHAYHGSVDWRITRRLAYGSVPAALLSLVLLAHLGSSSQASGGIISTTLGIALILTAVTLIFRKALLARLSRLMDGASEQRSAFLRSCSARFSACWCRFRPSAPAPSAQQFCSRSIRSRQSCASSAPTSPTRCR